MNAHVDVTNKGIHADVTMNDYRPSSLPAMTVNLEEEKEEEEEGIKYADQDTDNIVSTGGIGVSWSGVGVEVDEPLPPFSAQPTRSVTLTLNDDPLDKKRHGPSK